MTRKSIKIEEKNNIKFFHIYKVMAMTRDGGRLMVDEMFLNKKDAEKHKEIIDRELEGVYSGSYIVEDIVFC